MLLIKNFEILNNRVNPTLSIDFPNNNMTIPAIQNGKASFSI